MIEFFRTNFGEIASCAFSIICFVFSFVNYFKTLRQKKLSEIVSSIPEFITQIESIFPNGFGDVKLGFVLRWIEKLCLSARIPFDKQYMTEQVEKVLSAPSKKNKV